MAKIPYLSIVNRVYYIDPQGMKRTHIVGLNRPTAQKEITTIHNKCPGAIIVLQQDNNQAIQIVPGSGKASEAATKTLVNEIDKWAHGLQDKSYYPSVADWAIAAGDTVCVIQPPAKSAINEGQIDTLKNSIQAWIKGIVNAPAQQPNGQPNPNPGAGTGGSTPAPAQQPNGQPNPNPGAGTGGGAQAPADPLEGLTAMQRAGFNETMALIKKIYG